DIGTREKVCAHVTLPGRITGFDISNFSKCRYDIPSANANYTAASKISVLRCGANDAQLGTEPPDTEGNATDLSPISHQIQPRVSIAGGRNSPGQFDDNRRIWQGSNSLPQLLQADTCGFTPRFAEAAVIAKKTRKHHIDVLPPRFAPVRWLW